MGYKSTVSIAVFEVMLFHRSRLDKTKINHGTYYKLRREREREKFGRREREIERKRERELEREKD